MMPSPTPLRPRRCVFCRCFFGAYARLGVSVFCRLGHAWHSTQAARGNRLTKTHCSPSAARVAAFFRVRSSAGLIPLAIEGLVRQRTGGGKKALPRARGAPAVFCELKLLMRAGVTKSNSFVERRGTRDF